MPLTLPVVNITVTTIQSAFGDTPLASAVLEVLNCVILNKVQNIEEGLTFVNENAKVQFPRVDNSTFDNVLGSNSSIAVSSLDSSSVLDIVNTISEKWDASIRQQAIIAGILLAVYGVVVFIGMLRVIHSIRKNERNRAEGSGFNASGAHAVIIPPYIDGAFDSKFEGPGPTPYLGRIERNNQ